MNTKLATRQFRLEQWTGIIRDCRNSGMKVDDYLKTNGISRDQYYYWLRQVKSAALAQCENAGSFVEVPPSRMINSPDDTFSAQLTVSANGFTVAVNESTSSELLIRVLEAVSHVK